MFVCRARQVRLFQCACNIFKGKERQSTPGLRNETQDAVESSQGPAGRRRTTSHAFCLLQRVPKASSVARTFAERRLLVENSARYPGAPVDVPTAPPAG